MGGLVRLRNLAIKNRPGGASLDSIAPGVALRILQCASLALLGTCSQDRAVYTVPGPESSELVPTVIGYVVMDRPVGCMFAISIPDQTELVIRKQGQAPKGATVNAVSGPDARGRIAFIDNFMMKDRHSLKIANLHGGAEVELFTRQGDALWDRVIGEDISLSHHSGLLALVSNLKPRGQHNPDALLKYGTLEVWDLEKGEPLSVTTSALEDQMSWFPDGRRLAYTAFVAQSTAKSLVLPSTDSEFGKELLNWEHVPVVHVLDVVQGTIEPIHVGLRPAVSPDGKSLLFRDFELRWRLLNLETKDVRSLAAPGAIYPGPIAFVSQNVVLYWAWPTEGAENKWTDHNSPLVGPKQMRTLKLFDIESGKFQTAIPYIDPRLSVSFGVGG